METFEKTTLIDCSAKELFDFHLDTNNIKLITPKHTKVELLDYEDSTYEGKIVKLKTTRAFICMNWIIAPADLFGQSAGVIRTVLK